MPRLIQADAQGGLREHVISQEGLLIGRSAGLSITLEEEKVSRRHARVWREGPRCFIEDLNSRNGTHVNDKRITQRTELHPRDRVQIGSFGFRFEADQPDDTTLTIRQQTASKTSNVELFRKNPERKLQAVLELAHHLANSLDTDSLLQRFLDQLLVLFPHADRGLVIFSVRDELLVRKAQDRQSRWLSGPGFSRSVVRQVLATGDAMLAEDTQVLDSNLSISTLGIRSLIAVPLQRRGGQAFGVLELDRFQLGQGFTVEDLHLLTSITLQVCTMLENANLHQELLAQERIQRDLQLAREIQRGFLPLGVPAGLAESLELFGDLQPAQEIAGDFYDYLPLGDGQVMVVVGDVSGKGMPAAMFMVMVRALLRQLVLDLRDPADILARLDASLAQDNPKSMFVTLMLGLYDITKGRCVLARAGHPPAILRRNSGTVEVLQASTGRLLGIDAPGLSLSNLTVELHPGDALVLYTDGITEAVAEDSRELFGNDRLHALIATLPGRESLREWGHRIRTEVERFSRGPSLADDVTLLLLRRPR